jgi:Lon protease-like protein
MFPLGNVVLPGEVFPLHVFEPRYRQMAARCIETDRRFGVLFHDSDEGPFELVEDAVGCVAGILEFRPLPDGRSLMATRGLDRFRVVDGIESETLYTEALVEPLHDIEGDDVARLTARRFRTSERFRDAAILAGTPNGEVPRIDTNTDVSWQIARAFRIDEAWRQSLLEIRNEITRLDQIDRLLDTILPPSD